MEILAVGRVVEEKLIGSALSAAGRDLNPLGQTNDGNALLLEHPDQQRAVHGPLSDGTHIVGGSLSKLVFRDGGRSSVEPALIPG